MKPAWLPFPQSATSAEFKLRLHLSRAAIFLCLFSAGYMIGYLSSVPQFNLQNQFQPNCTAITVANSDTNPLPIKDHELQTGPPPHDLLQFKKRCGKPIPKSEILNTLIANMFEGIEPYEGFPSAEIESLIDKPADHPRGWGSTGAVFRDLIESVRPGVIIELGSFLGASALHMAGVTHNLSLSSTLILSVDDFRGWPNFRLRFRRDVPQNRHADALLLQQFMANVKAAGESQRIIPVPFSTGSALIALCEWGIYGDLIEVDAGHDFHSAWADINRAYAILRPGGVLFGHDYFTVADNRGVRRAVTLFAKVKGLTVRPHGQHWVLSPKPRE
ncbi:S-adenosyl-L-methionine-dependent methyltransferases superfamily protein [Rhynchospora pubera]|uniref:S-adenosyl-L-methionine-dependent methyltransferases superfamily protein n=1 Tax=Rhynchospora pubera TaxID=906938 RepID=A0AAV8GLN3_9POAL|nr:S-adenosyl-L-methionine-dependent methyltransferases superfamily protein [Rhynchospora pubera]